MTSKLFFGESALLLCFFALWQTACFGECRCFYVSGQNCLQHREFSKDKADCLSEVRAACSNPECNESASQQRPQAQAPAQAAPSPPSNSTANLSPPASVAAPGYTRSTDDAGSTETRVKAETGQRGQISAAQQAQGQAANDYNQRANMYQGQIEGNRMSSGTIKGYSSKVQQAVSNAESQLKPYEGNSSAEANQKTREILNRAPNLPNNYLDAMKVRTNADLLAGAGKNTISNFQEKVSMFDADTSRLIPIVRQSREAARNFQSLSTLTGKDANSFSSLNGSSGDEAVLRTTASKMSLDLKGKTEASDSAGSKKDSSASLSDPISNSLDKISAQIDENESKFTKIFDGEFSLDSFSASDSKRDQTKNASKSKNSEPTISHMLQSNSDTKNKSSQVETRSMTNSVLSGDSEITVKAFMEKLDIFRNEMGGRSALLEETLFAQVAHRIWTYQKQGKIGNDTRGSKCVKQID